MKTIKGDLILKEDTTFKESIRVEGNIKGWFNLKVLGNIDAVDINARNIDARDINAWDIDAWDIDAVDINAVDINARDIDAVDINARNINARNIKAGDIKAGDIICETRTKKSEISKTICRVYVKDRSKLKRKEQEI